MFKIGIRKHFKDALNYLDFIGKLAGFTWVLIMYEKEMICKEDDNDLLLCTWENDDEQENSRFMNFLNLLWTVCITIRATDMFSEAIILFYGNTLIE